MKAQEIANALRGKKTTKGFICHCPLPTHGEKRQRGDRKPSLWIDDGDNGGIVVKCHGGCDSKDVLAEFYRRGYINSEKSQGRPQRSKKVAPPPIEPDPDALALWRSAQPIEGTKAQRYLMARGIHRFPASLRFLPEFTGFRTFPAMVAGLQAGDGRVVGVQVTLLDHHTDRKADVKTQRLTYGAMHDGAIRLGPAEDVLGLAEGVETGLSAMTIFDIPIWCCLGARMDRVTIPETVRELHIFADNGEAGRKIVAKALERHRYRRVIVHYPDGYSDWNDALVAQGGAVR